MAPPSWVILSREASASTDLPQGAALSFALAEPPRVTTVSLHPSVCPVKPDPTSRHMSACILAADPSGLLLLLTPPPLIEQDVSELRTSRSPGDVRTSRGPADVERTARIGRVPRSRYIVCDVSSSSAASPVPDPKDISVNNDLGVIAAPEGGGRFMIVDFKKTVGAKATLLCFSSETGGWAKKRVINPQPGSTWTFSDVVSHGGKVWWVDKVAGLLGFDPFADEPAMEYMKLPEGADQHAERGLSSRLVQLCNGVFSCVEITYPGHGAPKVSMRTLADPATAEWTLEYEVSFSEIWAGDTYKAAGLPEKAPKLALVHPNNPDVVYFFLEERLFGVDMRAREVVECEPFEPTRQQNKCSFSSWLVFPFELPPAFSAGSSSISMAGNEGILIVQNSNSNHDMSTLSTIQRFSDLYWRSIRVGRIISSNLGVTATIAGANLLILTQECGELTSVFNYMGEYNSGGQGYLAVATSNSAKASKAIGSVLGGATTALACGGSALTSVGVAMQRLHPDAQTGGLARSPPTLIITLKSLEEARQVLKDLAVSSDPIMVDVTPEMDPKLAEEIFLLFKMKDAIEVVADSPVLRAKVSKFLDDAAEYHMA